MQWLNRAATAAVILLAAAILAITLIPVTVWRAPQVDATYHGFDPNLVFQDARGPGTADGRITLSRDRLDLVASPGSEPSLTVITTPLHRVDVAARITVLRADPGGVPLRFGLLSARGGAGAFLVFAADRTPHLRLDLVRFAGIRQTLVGGRTESIDLGPYVVGQNYPVLVSFDKDQGRLMLAVGDRQQIISVNRLPDLVHSVRVSLNISAGPSSAASEARVEGYTLTLPHGRLLASKVSDPRATIAMAVLLATGLLILAILLGLALRRNLVRWPRPSRPRGILIVGSLALAIAGAGNVLLFSLGSHPFDMLGAKVWSYTSVQYGPDQLYYVPATTTLAKMWQGAPYQEASFPYEPVLALPFMAAGVIDKSQHGATAFIVDSTHLEVVIKSINLLFLLADAVLIFLILGRLKLSRPWQLLGSGLFLFNPAVWFGASVWGTTQVISLVLILLAIWLIELRMPIGAWISIGLASVTRPQMLVPAFLLAVVLLRAFPIWQTIKAAAIGTVVTFLALAPLSLGIGPSLPVDVLLGQLAFQQGGGNEDILTTVTSDAYTVWPLVTGVVARQHGSDRLYYPSRRALVGSLTYQQVGSLFAFGAVLLSALLLLLPRRSRPPGWYIPIVTAATLAFLMFDTGIAAIYWVIGIALLTLCRSWLSAPVYLAALILWSGSSVVPMIGSLGIALSYGYNPSLPLNPTHSELTRTFIKLFTSDSVISIGSAANAVVLLAAIAAATLAPLRGRLTRARIS